jgi:adenylate cyclase
MGFTHQCEERPPAEAINLLRGFHRRMDTEQTIFTSGGAPDIFLKDGMTATFETPSPGSRDDADALACSEDRRVESRKKGSQSD